MTIRRNGVLLVRKTFEIAQSVGELVDGHGLHVRVHDQPEPVIFAGLLSVVYTK